VALAPSVAGPAPGICEPANDGDAGVWVVGNPHRDGASPTTRVGPSRTSPRGGAGVDGSDAAHDYRRHHSDASADGGFLCGGRAQRRPGRMTGARGTRQRRRGASGGRSGAHVGLSTPMARRASS